VQFSDLHLSLPILQAAKAQGYTIATPIQAQAIPHVLAGKDVLGRAQTGTGKTAAFAMPILHRLSTKSAACYPARKPRCLVLCPTRELATQIADSFAAYGQGLHLRHTTIFGGVSQHWQVKALRSGVEILVATPGRLMDLMQQRVVDLSAVEVLVLDEADRMLDMGFIQPIRNIVSRLPANRQTLLFSATMPPEIRRLADSLLRDPAVVSIEPVASTTAQIDERLYRVEKSEKPELLAHLVKTLPMSRALVFTRTKHGADRVVRHLHTRGIHADCIHGNKSQNARQRALANFVNNKIPVLVATDIASRGIDVDGITHVVNYDLTHEPETYVHRIGRTGRAGASGSAVSFCDRDEISNLKAIERLIRRTIPSAANPLGSRAADAAPRRDFQPEPANRHRPETARPRPALAAPAAHRPAARHPQRVHHPLHPQTPPRKFGGGGGGGGGYSVGGGVRPRHVVHK
jgi:ATP-dependent RNA helicase RhlE